MEQETWKAVNGYEGTYEISTFGNVRSLDRYVKTTKNLNGLQFVKGRYIKFGVDKDGYPRITLWKNGRSAYKRINQLMAIVFLPNPKNKPVVHHKDADVANNHIDNLEWATYSENVIYAIKAARKGVPRNKGQHNPGFLREKVGQFSLEGKLVKLWPSVKEIGRHYACERNIRKAIKGVKDYKTAYGFIWKKVDRNTENPIENEVKKVCFPCYVFEAVPKRVLI